MPVALIVPEMMRDVPGPYVDILEQAGFAIRYPQNPLLARGILSADETIAELSVADATIASIESYSPETLASLPRLKVIARCGVGYDCVDVPTATSRGIPVTITPTANHEAVTELALTLMFAAAKSLISNDKRIRLGDWPRKPVVPLRSRTLGIVGLGRIGSTLAFRAACLGMKVIAAETAPNIEFVRTNKIELVDLDTLLSRSDVVSIHCPLTDDTRGLFNKFAFEKMKPGSILINTSRGPLVVEKDLHAALVSGHLAAAGLDVFEQEPPSASNPLFQLDNVVVTPHIAGVDELSIEAMGVEAATCIATLYRNEWPDGAVVNSELQNGWTWPAD